MRRAAADELESAPQAKAPRYETAGNIPDSHEIRTQKYPHLEDAVISGSSNSPQVLFEDNLSKAQHQVPGRKCGLADLWNQIAPVTDNRRRYDKSTEPDEPHRRIYNYNTLKCAPKKFMAAATACLE